jgi:hypothetical protein
VGRASAAPKQGAAALTDTDGDVDGIAQIRRLVKVFFY